MTVQSELSSARHALAKAKNHLIKAYDDVNADHGDQVAAHAIYGVQLVVLVQEDAVLELEQKERRRNAISTKRRGHRPTGS